MACLSSNNESLCLNTKDWECCSVVGNWPSMHRFWVSLLDLERKKIKERKERKERVKKGRGEKGKRQESDGGKKKN